MPPTAQEDDQLAIVIRRHQLQPTTQAVIVARFRPLFVEAGTAVREAETVPAVTDPTQVTEIKASRAHRLKLRALRVEAETARKELKQDSLNLGRAIDGVAKLITGLIEPEETRLEHQETIAERLEAERIAKLGEERRKALTGLVADYNIQPAETLGRMSQVSFDAIVGTAKAAKEAELQRQQEAKRLAEENEKLRKQNAELERQRQAEAAKRLAEATQAAKDAPPITFPQGGTEQTMQIPSGHDVPPIQLSVETAIVHSQFINDDNAKAGAGAGMVMAGVPHPEAPNIREKTVLLMFANDIAQVCQLRPVNLSAEVQTVIDDVVGDLRLAERTLRTFAASL